VVLPKSQTFLPFLYECRIEVQKVNITALTKFERNKKEQKVLGHSNHLLSFTSIEYFIQIEENCSMNVKWSQ
jgi:hypothetical protein